MKFPSQEWVRAAAQALSADPSVKAAHADFGDAVVGVVVQRGAGLDEDFCVLARLYRNKPFELTFPEDEDELEELEPDYLAFISHELARGFLQAALRGERPDVLRAVLDRKIKLKGDLQRVVRMAGKHEGAGAGTLRALPTEFLP